MEKIITRDLRNYGVIDGLISKYVSDIPEKERSVIKRKLQGMNVSVYQQLSLLGYEVVTDATNNCRTYVKSAGEVTKKEGV